MSTARPPEGARAIVLDLDASVGPLAGEQRLAWGEQQEGLRFACSHARLRALRRELDQCLPAPGAHGTVLMGSGDFHHLSLPLIARAAQAAPPGQPLRVLVFDNHPDNMRFPFGVHCGSWVQAVSALPGVAHVHVVGISSPDIGWRHAWENRLGPLYRGKLSYWSVGVDTRWAGWLGLARAFRHFDDPASLIEALCRELVAAPQPTYLSIDKDVLSVDVVTTNWDQGRLDEAMLNRAIDTLRGRIVGSDITGDVSAYRYQTGWKRWLSRIDAQDTEIAPATLRQWQQAQHALNQRLVTRIAACAAIT